MTDARPFDRARSLVFGLGPAASCCWLALSGAGCASTPKPGAMPPDFAVAVTVRVPEAQADAWTIARQDQPRALRPGKYVVEPDSLLRVWVGPGAKTTSFPPPTRRLSQDQVAQLWAQVRDAGWTAEPAKRSAARPTGIRAEFDAEPGPVAESTAIIYIAAGGERYYRLEPLESNPASPARRLTDTLAEMAWLR